MAKKEKEVKEKSGTSKKAESSSKASTKESKEKKSKEKKVKIDELSLSCIRSLVIDIINKANSGHPGMSLGSAAILYTLYTKHLVSDPAHPDWINRDRFVLSAGHASALYYAILHLSGFKVSLDDLKKFRQTGSITPGHPEVGKTDGVDATSGPLGQGIAAAVGMAVAEQSIQANYRKGELLMDHYTYCLCGDGCLMEGVSQEAISYAGHEKLNKLILLYDNNDVTLDGPLSNTFSEKVGERFDACGWNVINVRKGNNVKKIDKAIKKAKKSKHKPTLIIFHTVIGFGSKDEGTSKVHGTPLGVEEGERVKKEVYHYDHKDFFIPPEVYAHFKKTFIQRGADAYSEYNARLSKKKYADKYKGSWERFNNLMDHEEKDYLPSVYPDFKEGEMISTRNASGKALNDYMLSLPNLMGGCADVASSVITSLEGGVDFTPKTRYGHNMNFGIREFAMASIQNGMLLHDGVRTYTGCFLVFSDYMKAAIRMAALSHVPAIYLFSHDSIAVGEDGPTHEPVEQVAALRSIPGLRVIRPCDEKETYAAWHEALKSTSAPTAIILCRQNLPVLKGSNPKLAEKGGYIVYHNGVSVTPMYELVATGSEVSLAINAAKALEQEGIYCNVISLPSWELFEEQPKEYRDSVLTLPKNKRVSIEMLSPFGWDKYADYHMSVETYGDSGKADEVMSKYHFTVKDAVELVKKIHKGEAI
ncbi:MAG: transketolase [Coprobacillus sp.]|nr:transketolase [Coprobacillus sp.]